MADTPGRSEGKRTRIPRNLRGRYAGFVSRALGLLIDQAIVIVTSLVFFWIVRNTLLAVGIDTEACPAFVPVETWQDVLPNICRIAGVLILLVSALLVPFYYMTFWILSGQTIGMRIAGIRVVRRNGERLKPRTALIRLFGFIVCALSLGIGFLTVIWNPKRQGWHDRMADTYVVYAWKHVPVPPLGSPLPPRRALDD